MGRWSQYRHRGRGGPPPQPSASLDPPVYPDDFGATGSGLALMTSSAEFFPSGADLIEVQFRVLFTVLWNAGNYMGPLDSADLVDPAVVDTVYEVQARWCLTDHTPVSDWCASVIVTITA